MTLFRTGTALFAVLLTAAASVAQSAQSTTTPIPATAGTSASKDQQKDLKKQEDASKEQAKAAKAQRKALKQEDKAAKAAAKAK